MASFCSNVQHARLSRIETQRAGLSRALTAVHARGGGWASWRRCYGQCWGCGTGYSDIAAAIGVVGDVGLEAAGVAALAAQKWQQNDPSCWIRAPAHTVSPAQSSAHMMVVGLRTSWLACNEVVRCRRLLVTNQRALRAVQGRSSADLASPVAD